MLSLKNSFSHLLLKIITLAFTAIFSVCSLNSGICKEPAEAPEDFTAVLRFAVCSDIHIDGEDGQINAKRFETLFKDSYSYSEAQDSYKALDAVMVCGDMTGIGEKKQYAVYKDIVENNLKDGTLMLQCMGNHEFIEARENDGVDPYKNYEEYVNEEVNTHTVINGYHFIGVSYSDKDENFDKATLKWLDGEIKKATEDTPNKPVFVFQHPHPTLTVYGSVNWGDISIRSVLTKYPQVVNFSGHSHNATSDPRSVWQGSFTAIGTGSLSSLLGNLNYIKSDCEGSVPSASFYIAEVDKDGNMRLLNYDCENRVFFDNEYYFENPSERSNRVYSWGNMYSLDTRPAFPENAEIKATINESGETVITFPSAMGYFEAESYKISVTKGLKNFYSETVLSNYITAVDDDMNINIGILESGEYTVSIIPSSPYAKTGKALNCTITVE